MMTLNKKGLDDPERVSDTVFWNGANKNQSGDGSLNLCKTLSFGLGILLG